MRFLLLILFCALIGAFCFSRQAYGCDICEIYVAQQAKGDLKLGFSAGVFEQFTHHGTMQEDGREIANPFDQYLDSSNTQIFLGYRFIETLAAHVNIPILYRDFQRLEEGVLEKRSVEGLGDMSLLFDVQPVRWMNENSVIIWELQAGIKFPTGSIDELKRDLTQDHDHDDCPPGFVLANPGEEPHDHETPDEHEDDGHDHEHLKTRALFNAHSAAGSGAVCAPEARSAVHGHDITLGTGSFDAIIGTRAHVGYRRVFANAKVQYIARTENDFGYEFGNELIWAFAPGFYPLLNQTFSLGLEAEVSGADKQYDTHLGIKDAATRSTEVSMGPRATFTFRNILSFFIGAEFPVFYDNSDVQIIPDYRIQSGLSVHL